MSFGEHLMMMGGGSDSQAGCDGGSLPSYPYKIGQSCRFADNRTSHLSRTLSAAGNRRIWTWSGWVKRGNLGSNQNIFASNGTDNTTYLDIRFNSSDQLQVGNYTSLILVTTQVFRDPSAWYHVVWLLDTTQATASNRSRLFVNGVEITSFSTDARSSYFAQNTDYGINNSALHEIARNPADSAKHFDGYMAEVNFVDGQALDASSFGEWSEGTWVPKGYTGDRGTNGFYLDFVDGGNLGKDAAGSNDWTSNNLAVTDQVPDSPTNNFATLNPLWSTLGTLSEGNLKNTTPGSGRGTRASTFVASSGKYYCEILFTEANPASPANARIGVIRSDSSYAETSNFTSAGFNGIGYASANGYVTSNGTDTNTGGATYTNGDIIGIALDMDAGEVSFYKNNTVVYSAINPSSLLDSGSWMFVCADSSNSHAAIFYTNFGQDSSFAGQKTAQGHTDANGIGDFYYQPPAGYLALCTANLPEPEVAAQNHFNTVLYQGDDALTRNVTGVGFEPGLVWKKSRTDVLVHGLHDIVRGGGKSLCSHLTNAEAVDEMDGYLDSFDDDGFTLSAGSRSNATFNRGTDAYVSWNWKAGGAGVPNNDGTIPSVVSANPCAGFSIVGYAGNGEADQKVGHGLSQTPDCVIVKSRTAEYDFPQWYVYHTTLPTDHFIYLNATNAAVLNGNYFVHSLFSDSVFGVGSDIYGPNVANSDYIAYCFHSVDGFSKFGSYTGTGSTDGPFVYCGFRPAFVMYKSTNNAYGWGIADNRRTAEFNPADGQLYPHSNASEGNHVYADLLSNGFKLRGTGLGENASGSNIIFMAFAEQPFKYANAR